MNEENEKILMAEAIVKEDPNQIMAYKIDDDTYIFANYKDNACVGSFPELKALINRSRNIKLIYVSDKETEKKIVSRFLY